MAEGRHSRKLELPPAWADALGHNAIRERADTLAEARANRCPSELVGEDVFTAHQDDFVRSLWSVLHEDGITAVVYDPSLPAGPVTVLLGGILGGVTQQATAPMREPVIHVRADPNAAVWHTDASIWREPTRWSLLGLHTADPDHADATTDLRSFDRAIGDWDDDPALLEVLRDTPVPWRGIFSPDQIAPLDAPVLADVRRWHGVLRAGELAVDNHTPLGRACKAFDRALSLGGADHRVAMTAGQVLVWDNHRFVHRAPSLPADSSRTVVVLITGGVPD